MCSNSPDDKPVGVTVTLSIVCVVCIFGLMGNGTVIWLLGFRMKRTPFTTYILNLAIADFWVLIFLLVTVASYFAKHGIFLIALVNFGLLNTAYSTSQFLLTSISIDRCVCVLFPLWYRFRRPKKFSPVLCAVIWLLACLVQGICIGLHFTPLHYYPIFYVFLGYAVVCLPLITISTLILLVRFCFKPQQRQRGKLFTVILLTLFFFLIFAFPLNVINLISFNPNPSLVLRLHVVCYHLYQYSWLCTSLNSFVNPLLYFLVGRKERGLSGEKMKLILQRVFIEEEEPCREEPEIQLGDLQQPPSPRKIPVLAEGERL